MTIYQLIDKHGAIIESTYQGVTFQDGYKVRFDENSKEWLAVADYKKKLLNSAVDLANDLVSKVIDIVNGYDEEELMKAIKENVDELRKIVERY